MNNSKGICIKWSEAFAESFLLSDETNLPNFACRMIKSEGYRYLADILASNLGLLLLTVLVTAAECRISVMYAHDKLSDMVAQQCFTEMYPKNKQIEIQESDEPCLIFCVLRKLGIMSSSGQIVLDNYRKRVQIAHQLDQRILTNDFGSNCVESAEATQHKQDVCKKAKVFNDCTHLYRILLK